MRLLCYCHVCGKVYTLPEPKTELERQVMAYAACRSTPAMCSS